jgi:DNA topoisomerase-1
LAGFREVDCNGPGIARRRAGRGFTYRDARGRRIADPEVLDRIAAIAIPPAWEDVWICSDPRGHIQATGVDARGRRQYRYHQAWQEHRSAEKHERVVEFAKRLPDLRRQVAADLALEGLPKARVLACAVRLLEVGCFRVGGEVYAEDNGSFGLATMQRQHVRVRGDRIHFDFDAKSGQHLRRVVADRKVRDVVTALRRRRGQPTDELLAYQDEDGRWVDVRSSDVNDYLHEHLGEDFSAKDFRTWVGTVLAALALADAGPDDTETARRKTVKRVVTEVAEHLGNTPAVARSAYIDPRVVERFESDDTAVAALRAGDVEAIERAVRRLLARSDRAGR